MRLAQNKFYWATQPQTINHELKVLAHIEGKRVLEIGCSEGKRAKKYTKFCASFVGIDISDLGVPKAKKIPNAEFLCVDAHKIPFRNGEFDIVIVNGLLHHLCLLTALKEIYHVLVKDGMLLFREPLGINPLYQLYRVLTPNSRTIDARPFTFTDIKLLSEYFDMGEVSYFGFFSLISSYLRIPLIIDFLSRIDSLLAQTFLKYFFGKFLAQSKSVRQKIFDFFTFYLITSWRI